jgi:4'-phosphopantetheinyl transferase
LEGLMNTGHEEPWPCASTDSCILPRGVKVWAARLDVGSEGLARFWQTLSSQEQERANRFAIEPDRMHFVAARGHLRAILSSCLSAEPSLIEFSYSSKGKPALAGEFVGCGLQFNLAHSGGLALFAINPQGQVGVDVEEVRPVPEMAALMERFFSAAECVEIKGLAGEEQLRGFYRIWTRKEACLKATGEGITGALSSVDVTGPSCRINPFGGTRESSASGELNLFDLAPAAGFLGALALSSQSGT